MRLVELGAEDVLAKRRAELEVLWQAVWPKTTDQLYAILPRHARRKGFLFLALEEEADLVGFAYGYVGGEGEAWHRRIAAAMTEEQRARWLQPGELEFVELGVHPACRRRGLGTWLNDELLARAGRPTAVLTTEVQNEPAKALYGARGWKVIVPEIVIGRPYTVMGWERGVASPQ